LTSFFGAPSPAFRLLPEHFATLKKKYNLKMAEAEKLNIDSIIARLLEGFSNIPKF